MLSKIKDSRLFRAAASFLAQEREVLLAFFATRSLLWVLGWLAFYWIKHGDHQIFPGTQLWNLLFHWDSLWYARIVAHGYGSTTDAQSSVSFFPLLPICIYALRSVTGMGTALAGFLISNASLLTASILLRRLVALDFPAPSRVAERTVWLLLLGPMTFFHSAIYTESLFLMLSIAAVLLARQRRWAGAGLTGALLTATHGKGILILVPLLWEALVAARSEPAGEGARVFRSRWWLIIVPSGLIAFATYLHFRFGDALAFLHGQAAFNRELAAPWEGLEIASRYPIPYGHFFIAAVVTALALCILGFFMRIRMSYRVYVVGALLFCLSTTIWESMPRYLSAIFPFYLTLAVATIRSEALYIFAITASTGLMTLCLVLYVCGYFMT